MFSFVKNILKVSDQEISFKYKVEEAEHRKEPHDLNP